MSSIDPLKTVAGIVPEFYYDLIARVVPGILTLLVSALAFAALAQLGLSEWSVLFSRGSFLLLLVLSYFLGVVLGPFGSALRRPFWWWAHHALRSSQLETVRRYSKKQGKSDRSFIPLDQFKSFEKVLEGKLADRLPHDRLVLLKMWAESDMCLNVLAGSLLANLAALVSCLPTQIPLRHWQELQWVMTPVIAILVVTANFRHRGTIRRDFAYIDRLERLDRPDPSKTRENELPVTNSHIKTSAD